VEKLEEGGERGAARICIENRLDVGPSQAFRNLVYDLPDPLVFFRSRCDLFRVRGAVNSITILSLPFSCVLLGRSRSAEPL
jgi:hypothetical protein